jgi:hypothetical protein
MNRPHPTPLMDFPISIEIYHELLAVAFDTGFKKEYWEVGAEALADWLRRHKPEAIEMDKAGGYQWKHVFLPNGTLLRTVFSGKNHHCTVEDDRILYEGRAVSPSGFVNAIGGIRRNAWKSLWVLLPDEKTWKLADSLRPPKRTNRARARKPSMPLLDATASMPKAPPAPPRVGDYNTSAPQRRADDNRSAPPRVADYNTSAPQRPADDNRSAPQRLADDNAYCPQPLSDHKVSGPQPLAEYSTSSPQSAADERTFSPQRLADESAFGAPRSLCPERAPGVAEQGPAWHEDLRSTGQRANRRDEIGFVAVADLLRVPLPRNGDRRAGSTERRIGDNEALGAMVREAFLAFSRSHIPIHQ